MSFEKSLARLESIVEEMDGDDVSLDQALALFEEGISHLRVAGEELRRADASLKVLQENAAGVLTLVEPRD